MVPWLGSGAKHLLGDLFLSLCFSNLLLFLGLFSEPGQLHELAVNSTASKSLFQENLVYGSGEDTAVHKLINEFRE